MARFCEFRRAHVHRHGRGERRKRSLITSDASSRYAISLSSQKEGMVMLDHAVVIYCVCDEVCQSLNIRDDIQCKMTSAEVMTFAILSAMVFGCGYKRTRLIAQYQRLFSAILSHSQLVRRIHRIDQQAWTMTFLALRFLLRDSEKKPSLSIAFL